MLNVPARGSLTAVAIREWIAGAHETLCVNEKGRPSRLQREGHLQLAGPTFT
jgi:hypothetical protein